MSDELCERLRQRVVIQKGREWTAVVNGEKQSFSTGDIVQVFPLGEEVATRIEALTAEITRLKAIMLDEDVVLNVLLEREQDWTLTDCARAVTAALRREINQGEPE